MNMQQYITDLLEQQGHNIHKYPFNHNILIVDRYIHTHIGEEHYQISGFPNHLCSESPNYHIHYSDPQFENKILKIIADQNKLTSKRFKTQ